MEFSGPYSPTFPVFSFMFLVICIFGYFSIFRNWGRKNRSEASSCLMSLVNGTPSVPLALHSIYHASKPSSPSFASKNTDSQNTILEFSIGYFSVDLSHLLLFSSNDFPFIAHHLATLFVFTTCRFAVGHGAHGILLLLILAEATSPCQNAWCLSRARRDDIPVAARVHEFLKVPFYGLYSVARGVLGPMFLYEMGAFYARGNGGDAVPTWVWLSWMVVIVCAIMGSMLWVLNLWVELYRDKRGKVQEKKN